MGEEIFLPLIFLPLAAPGSRAEIGAVGGPWVLSQRERAGVREKAACHRAATRLLSFLP
jgi:hypothetical protein